MSWREWWSADFLSPKDLLRRSLLLLMLFAIAHLAGLRDFTSILNGTIGSVTLGWHLSVFLGLSYVLFYFAVVVLVPILGLAALLSVVAHRWSTRMGQHFSMEHGGWKEQRMDDTAFTRGDKSRNSSG